MADASHNSAIVTSKGGLQFSRKSNKNVRNQQLFYLA